MAFARGNLTHPVAFEHDGETVLAERGEPLAVALLAADRLLLARSPKLHRPRGPSCLRGACDGCLARVDGVPNVMTCLRPARGGEQVETQNVLGSRGADLLRAADFLFPHGVDHHRLMAGVRGLGAVTQAFARRVAGLGRLPEEAAAALPVEHLEVDVLIVGGGRAGLGAARQLEGRQVALVDDGVRLGGSLAALQPARAAETVDALRRLGVRLLEHHTVAGLYPLEGTSGALALVVGEERTLELRARRVLLATGAHDAPPPFGNNDLPGVLSARALLGLLRAGVRLEGKLALVGEGPYAEQLAALVPEPQRWRVALDAVVEARGLGRVRALVAREGERRVRRRLAVVAVDAPPSPALELAVQLGARASFEPAHGYTLERDARGLAAPGVYLAGSVSLRGGAKLSGEEVARALLMDA